MPQDKLSIVLRILDNESQLIERADRKAIALLSILGVFMVFFGHGDTNRRLLCAGDAGDSESGDDDTSPNRSPRTNGKTESGQCAGL